MGCRKLTYYETETTPLKVATGTELESEKVVQGFISVDPLYKHYPFISNFSFALNMPIGAIDIGGEKVYIIITTNASADISDASKTRVDEILNSDDFDEENDKVYVIEISDLGKLKEKVEAVVVDAKENDFGKTVEVSVFSHASFDGPRGEEKTSGENGLDKVTGNDIDAGQLSPSGWKEINFNFDPEESVAAFYGCNTDEFAQKFLVYQKNVKYTVGIDGRSGGSEVFIGEFDPTSANIIFGYIGPVYLVTTTNPTEMDLNAEDKDIVDPRNVYSRESEIMTFNNKGTNVPIIESDSEGNRYPIRKPKKIHGNVTADPKTKEPKSGS